MTCLWWTCRGCNRGWILSFNKMEEDFIWTRSLNWFGRELASNHDNPTNEKLQGCFIKYYCAIYAVWVSKEDGKRFEICTAGLEFESGRALLVRDWDSRNFTRSSGPTKYAFQGMRFPRIQNIYIYICCVGIFLVDTLGWESVFKQNEEEESEQSYNFYSQINPIIFNELLYC